MTREEIAGTVLAALFVILVVAACMAVAQYVSPVDETFWNGAQ